MMKTHLFLTLLLLHIATNGLTQTPGSLDTTFGTAGYATTDFLTQANASTFLLLQPDGKIIVLGNAVKSQTFTDIVALRYSSTGALDDSFGNGGIYSEAAFGLSLPTIKHREVWSGALQADGKILLAGIVWTTLDESFKFLIRLNPNGVPDPSFGKNGISLFINNNAPPPQYEPRPVSITVLDDGKILMFTGDVLYPNFTLIRFTAAGEPDATFGNAGVLHIKSSLTSNFYQQARALAIQPDHKILAQGVSNKPPGLAQMHIFRLLPDGSRDNTFSDDGEAITDGNGDYQTNELHNHLGLLPDGKIVVGMYSSLYRFQTNGQLDSTFGTNGKVLPALKTNCLIVQPDGKIVCASSQNSKATLYRLNSNGSADQSFGSAGIADFLPASSNFMNLVEQPDGKIIASGQKTGDFAIARYFSQTVSNTDDQSQLLGEITLNPNPTRDAVQVAFTLPEARRLSTTLLNTTGQLVRVVDQPQFFTPGEYTRQIDLSDLPSGAYILSFNGNKGKRNFVINLVK